MALPGPMLGGRRRSLSGETLVRIRPLAESSGLPLLFEPAIPGIELFTWAAANKESIESHLQVSGAILFRGFDVKGVDDFERTASTVSGALLEYSYASTPRTKVSGRVYTSTEYPAHQTIPLHNEMSYTRHWPMRILFYCDVAPETGGETPICDSRKVYADIDPAVRDEFRRKGVRYVRNFGAGLDLTWQAAFQTGSKDELADACRAAGIEFTWEEADRLVTRQTCQGVADHPRTGEHVWFNQAHLFHVSALPPEVRNFLSRDESELPRNACYGDGTPIDDAVLDHVRAVYERHSVQFRWQANDVLMMDNMLAAHGRRPFRGARRILVAMADPLSV